MENGMLVLSRKRQEKLIITLPDGRLITVVVVEIRGDKVRLGTLAPADCQVDREEVHNAKATGAYQRTADYLAARQKEREDPRR